VNRLTEDDSEEIFPLSARDGKRIIYTDIHNGLISIHQRNIGAVTNEVLIRPQSEELFAPDTSLDGRYLIYQRTDPKTGFDIWGLPLGGGGTPIPIVQTDADEASARLSPDGRWIAFSANNSGAFEVYVQAFPGPGRPSRVSTKGGDQPQWRPDGAELFYIALDGRLMAASVKPSVELQTIDPGPPVPLFAAQVGAIGHPFSGDAYAAAPDGRTFLLSRFLRKGGDTPLRVVLNWSPAR
jgi:Tol biopolymer transport system component